jgi:hypothetical protein
MIKQLISHVGHRWLCVGDFNDVVSSDDKRGGIPRTLAQMSLGREAMEVCGLSEFGFEGYPFTWSNGREDQENIQCRLDRAMGSENFLNRFAPIRVFHLPRFGSDHAAILIHLEADPNSRRKRRKRIFIFEECWAKDPRCEDVVKQSWTNAPSFWEAQSRAVQCLDEGTKFLKFEKR